MKQLIQSIDDLPLIVKIIFCIPAIDVIWTIYRLCRSIDKQNTLGIILAIVLFFFAPFVWLIDLICVILNNKVWWLD